MIKQLSLSILALSLATPVSVEAMTNCDITDPNQQCAHSVEADQKRTKAQAQLFLDRSGDLVNMCFGNYKQYYKKSCGYFL